MSPDGKTLLILTSGYNLNLDPAGNFQPQDSGEYVFVYDISKPSLPVKKQDHELHCQKWRRLEVLDVFRHSVTVLVHDASPPPQQERHPPSELASSYLRRSVVGGQDQGS